MIKYVRNIYKLINLLYLVIKYSLYPRSGYTYPLYILSIIFSPIKFFKQLYSKEKISFGQNLLLILPKLGPVYIKFGQVLSTRPDIIGEEVADYLKILQDKLPPFSSEEVISIIEDTWGDINKLFSKFDLNPIAAASISQVHKAETKCGSVVALKILRPNIIQLYKEDIDFLYFLAHLVEKFIHKTKRLRLKEIVKIFDESMKIELDLRLEAAANSELAEKFLNDENLYIPKIFWNLTTDNILTSEWIDGISLYDKERLLACNINIHELAKKLAIIFFNQVYRDGYFHADLHPGNIFVLKDGRVALIDFGIMGRLAEKDRLAVAEILYGFLQRDYLKVARIHIKAGYVPKATNVELFAQSCRAIGEPIAGLPTKQISISNLLGQLFKVTEDFSMETQPQLILLQKTMVVIEGISKSLDPDINMWLLAEKWIKKWAVHNLTPEAKLIRYFKVRFDELVEDICP